MREQLIQNLTNSMNSHYNSSLTFEQVDHWVGSDTKNETIEEYIDEVIDSPETSVTPDDVLSLWEDCL